MTVQLLNLNDCEYGFLAGGGAYIRFSDIAIANKYTDRYGKELAITAQKLNAAVKVFYSDQDYFEYPCWLIEKYKDTWSDFEMAELIYYSGTEGIPPQLHDLSRRLFDIDVSAGIVRMGDGKQIVLNDQANCTLKVASLNDATNWTRQEYYHPSDLEIFLLRCQQELEPNNPASTIENTYRVFTPEYGIQSENGWQEVISSYQIYEVDGQFYQLCQNVTHRDISRPTDLRI